MAVMACSLPDRLKLAMAFDPDRLVADLAHIDRDWIAHLVSQNYEGDWSVLPLRHKAGNQAARRRSRRPQISTSAAVSSAIIASSWAGPGVKRSRSVPRGTVG